ncbi:MAG: hypothetical protein IH983_08065 [Planctomycetes bacterium]|nr:hypothetical protein [Planctomycetota bacterium]
MNYQQLWKVLVPKYFDCSFVPIAAARQSVRWERASLGAAIVIGLVGSSSAVSSWALWQEPGFSWVLPTISGLVSVWIIIAGATNVPKRIRELENRRRKFGEFRIKFQNIVEAAIQETVGADDLQRRYVQVRDDFDDAYNELPSDPLITRKFIAQIEHELRTEFRKKGLIK